MKTKVTVSIEEGLIREIDQLVDKATFGSRSAALEEAIQALRAKLADEQLERALAAMTPEDHAEMQEMAEWGMADYAKQLEEFPW